MDDSFYILFRSIYICNFKSIWLYIMTYFELKGKNIFYVIGPYGSGKSRMVDDLAKQWNIFTVRENAAVRHLLAAKYPRIQVYTYISNMYYEITQHYLLPFFTSPPILVIDGHPGMAQVYQRTFGELSKNPVFKYEEDAYDFHYLMYDYMKETLMKDAQEFIIYLNIPFEKNWEFVEKRWKEERHEDFEEELDKDYLQGVRNNIELLLVELDLPVIEINDPDYDLKEIYDKIVSKAE